MRYLNKDELDEIWLKHKDKNPFPCQCQTDDNWSQLHSGRLDCTACNTIIFDPKKEVTL